MHLVLSDNSSENHCPAGCVYTYTRMRIWILEQHSLCFRNVWNHLSPLLVYPKLGKFQLRWHVLYWAVLKLSQQKAWDLQNKDVTAKPAQQSGISRNQHRAKIKLSALRKSRLTLSDTSGLLDDLTPNRKKCLYLGTELNLSVLLIFNNCWYYLTGMYV